MKIGFIGLGKMGQQMVTRLLKSGHEVIVRDVNQAAVDTAARLGAEASNDRADMVQKLDGQKIVWLMIPSGFVDNELTALAELLPEGSVVVDGGNSDFRLTKKRGDMLAQKNISLVDVGTSGGILGAEHGFSMMIGGDQDVVGALEPLFLALGEENGWRYFGPRGVGHYIKMVHNAIEYGMMEAYAEGYRLLHDGPYADLELGAIGEVWQHGSIIASTLNSLSKDVLLADPNLEASNGVVAESGEARWTLEVAQAEGITMPAVQAALEARIASQTGQTNFGTKLLALQRHAFGGHEAPKA